MDAESRFRDPATLFFQSDHVRRYIIASYWVLIALALPLWWKTTSIERLPLPTSEVYTQAQRKLEIPLEICVDSTFSSQIVSLRDAIRVAASYLDVHINTGQDCSMSSTLLVFPGYAVLPGEKLYIEDRKLYYPSHAENLASTFTSLLATKMDRRAAQYSPRYRLSFTLLNEDGSAGQVITGWDIQQAIARHIYPITSALGILHNFTIESQVQFHAPLAFEPQSFSNEGTFGLTAENLTVFINSAEWVLSSSSSNDPVLHFVLFVPSATRRPLEILSPDGTPSSSSAFLIPQWGGIVILNLPAPPPNTLHLTLPELRSSFSSFSRQLSTLLGLPRLPPSISYSSPSKTALSPWQVDTLLRQRTRENVMRSHDTLRSTVTLVSRIDSMPVDEQVQAQVQGSLKALNELFAYARNNITLNEMLAYSARALTLSSKAFFHPGMLAMLYFPTEHKYAVYTPLFASAMIPLLAAALREIAAWRKERREARDARVAENANVTNYDLKTDAATGAPVAR
ncbi:phosphatidylinositol-glycan biosynthesis class S protein-domain-containing protein [Lentinula aciculospora]|uniref:Phosphatidylinositol-glycan biosynthesis class S protein-domain-containing protein n=1 Tax=Lentinula aciculospora TaxID=153920 RepID=A0A9W9DVB5_9AGAR|nr:phosphatidylinositol-glycan biosynthesis class S protein-domain-containing protein [Lentinula aciculospora]